MLNDNHNYKLNKCTGYACRADKDPYRHDRRADQNPYRHDRRADSQCRRYHTSPPHLVHLPIYLLASPVGCEPAQEEVLASQKPNMLPTGLYGPNFEQ